jgi:hypothetical protein
MTGWAEVLRRVGRVGLVGAMLAAGCAAPADPRQVPVPPPGPAAVPVRGACHLLDPALVEAHLGLVLEVAAARDRDGTHTCVRRPEVDRLPELVLTVTPTTMDLPAFVEVITPAGATAVSALGKAGYQGPGLEVGWLSGDDRLLVLSLALPGDADLDRYAGGLLDLARTVDRARN